MNKLEAILRDTAAGVISVEGAKNLIEALYEEKVDSL